MRRHRLRTLIVASIFLVGCAAADAREQQFADLGRCELVGGAVLEPCTIGYRTIGTLNEARDNTILFPTWYGGTSEGLVEIVDSGLLDPDRYFIVLVDALGNGISTSPSTSPTQPNEQFPAITIRDMVESQHRLATEVLGLDRLHAVVGASMGGMQAFQWAVSHPGFAAKTVTAIGSPQLASFDIVLWETQIELLELYRACECDQAKELMTGVRLLTSEPTLLSEQLERAAVGAALARAASEQELDLPKTWDIERQARAMIEHDVAATQGGSLDAAARVVDSEVFVVVAEHDRVVTPAPALAFAELLGAETLVLDHRCGHAAPWCDAERFNTAVNEFLTARPTDGGR